MAKINTLYQKPQTIDGKKDEKQEKINFLINLARIKAESAVLNPEDSPDITGPFEQIQQMETQEKMVDAMKEFMAKMQESQSSDAKNYIGETVEYKEEGRTSTLQEGKLRFTYNVSKEILPPDVKGIEAKITVWQKGKDDKKDRRVKTTTEKVDIGLHSLICDEKELGVLGSSKEENEFYITVDLSYESDKEKKTIEDVADGISEVNYVEYDANRKPILVLANGAKTTPQSIRKIHASSESASSNNSKKKDNKIDNSIEEALKFIGQEVSSKDGQSFVAISAQKEEGGVIMLTGEDGQKISLKDVARIAAKQKEGRGSDLTTDINKYIGTKVAIKLDSGEEGKILLNLNALNLEDGWRYDKLELTAYDDESDEEVATINGVIPQVPIPTFDELEDEEQRIVGEIAGPIRTDDIVNGAIKKGIFEGKILLTKDQKQLPEEEKKIVIQKKIGGILAGAVVFEKDIDTKNKKYTYQIIATISNVQSEEQQQINLYDNYRVTGIRHSGNKVYLEAGNASTPINPEDVFRVSY